MPEGGLDTLSYEQTSSTIQSDGHEAAGLKVNVLPNPSRGRVEVSIAGPMTCGTARYRIQDFLGRTLVEGRFDEARSTQQLDLHGLAAGTYALSIAVDCPGQLPVSTSRPLLLAF